jgi:uncharacterized protein involved in outer membrane biogenesis
MQGQHLRWRKIVLWSGFGLLALIALTTSWLLLADLGIFKPHIERWASAATGRTVAIDGDLHIDLAMHSTIIVEGLRISNADWADEPEMVSVGRLETRFELLSLLRGPLVIDLIDLEDTRVALARPETGLPNWVLMARDEDVAETDGAGLVPLIQQLGIDNVAISYSTPVRAKPMQLHILMATQRYRQDDFLEIVLTGTLNDREVRLDGEIGAWNNLLAGKNVSFDVGARVDSLVVNAAGEIDELARPVRPRITFDASAPDVNDLLQALNVQRLGEGDISVNGSITPKEQGPLVLEVAGRVGRLDVDASGAFSDLLNLREFELDVLASGEDVRPILEAIGIPETRPSPFMVNINAIRAGSSLIINQADMVFGEAKFEMSARLPEFPRIDNGVIKVRFDGPDIERFRQVFNLPGAATGPFAIGLTVDVADDGFELFHVDVRSSLGQANAKGRLGEAPKFLGTTLDFQLSSDDIGKVGRSYGIRGLPDQAAEIRGGVEIAANGIRTTEPVVATVEDMRAEIEGLIQPVRGLLGSDFAFVVQGPDLARTVGAFTLNTGVPVQPYNLQGRLELREDGYRIRGVSGKLGTSDVELDGLLVPRRGIVGSRFMLEASGADINEIAGQFGDLGVRPGPYELSGTVNFQADRIEFDDIALRRAIGKFDLDFELGLPVAERSAKLDLQASGPNVQAILARFSGFAADEAPFQIDLDGSVEGSALQINNLDIQVGLATLQAAGGLDLAGNATTTPVNVSVNMPDTAALGTVNGRRLRSQDFVLDAEITSGNGEMRADNVVARMGGSDIKGALRLVTGAVPQLKAEIEAGTLVLAHLFEIPAVPDGQPAAALEDGRLIPDVEVPFEAMARLDADINIEAGHVTSEMMHLRDMVLQARLAGGRLDLTNLQFKGLAGALRARGFLDPQDGMGAADLEVVARDFALGLSPQNRDLATTGDIDVNLESAGTNLRDLLGNATGVVFLNGGGGAVIQNRTIRALYGDALQEIFSAINPFSKTEAQTTLECMVLPLEIESGNVTSNPNSLIATSRIQIVMNSQINLKTEEIRIDVKTTPKKGMSISAGEIVNPYLNIVGTLAKPRLGVDEKGALLTGGAAFATGGISILASAAWNRLSRSKDPCAALAAAGRKNLADRLPTLSVAP